MKKIRGIIDRFEEDQAVVRSNGDEVIIPKKYLTDFKEGDAVSVLIANEEEDTKNSTEVARALVSDLFKEE